MNKLASLFIAIVLSYGLFSELKICAFPRLEDGNAHSWLMFEGGGYGAEQIPASWKSRALSFELSAGWSAFWLQKTTPYSGEYDVKGDMKRLIWNSDQYKNCNLLASYYATWFLITCTILVYFLENPIIPMIGTFASILTCAPGFLAPYILPWDMPSMLLFTAAYFVWRARAWTLLIFISFFGGLINETVLVTTLFLLNWCPRGASAILPLKIRIIAIACIVILSQLVNRAICGAPPDWSYSVPGTTGVQFHFANLFKFWPVLLANAGGLVLTSFILLKRLTPRPFDGSDSKMATLTQSVVWFTFIILQLANWIICGIYSENRVWLDIAPIGWILIGEFSSTASNTSNQNIRTNDYEKRKTSPALRP